MKVTAQELKDLGIIDQVIPEPEPACSENMVELCRNMRKRIRRFLYENMDRDPDELAEERYQRFRRM